MEEALRALLVSSEILTDLVGTNLSWDTHDQGKAYPGVVMFLISEVPDYSMAGATGLVMSRVQIECRAELRREALDVARAVDAVLSGYSGTQGNIKFRGIFKENGGSDFEDNGPTKLYRVHADYIVWSGLAA